MSMGRKGGARASGCAVETLVTLSVFGVCCGFLLFFLLFCISPPPGVTTCG